MGYELKTLLIKGYRVVSTTGECIEEWYGPNDFEKADDDLARLRTQNPSGHFELLAEVDA